MFRLVESICVEDGEPKLLDFHQKRMEKVYKQLYKTKCGIDIKEMLADINMPENGRYKCRVVYNKDKREITFEPYVTPEIESLRIITDDNLFYPYKYEKRTELDKYKYECADKEDFIIVRKNLLTDAYYYNLVLIDAKKKQKVTPKEPLLKGVMREYLLKTKQISLADISIKDLSKYKEVHLINAMNPLGHIVVPLERIKTCLIGQ